MIASRGPWAAGYGFRQDVVHIEVQVSATSDGLQFTQTAPTAPGTNSAVIIEELNDSMLNSVEDD